MAINEGQVVLNVLQGIHVWSDTLKSYEKRAKVGQFWYNEGQLFRCRTDNEGRFAPSRSNPYFDPVGITYQFTAETSVTTSTVWTDAPGTTVKFWRFRYNPEDDWSNPIPTS